MDSPLARATAFPRRRALESCVSALGLVAALALCNCDPDDSDPTPATPATSQHYTGVRGDGKISIDWSVGGQPATAASCAGVDHLLLSMRQSRDEGFTVSPIPCDLDRFRYDDLPTGSGTLTLEAFAGPGDNGCAVAAGSVDLDIGTELPASPIPIAISAVSACR